MNVDVFQSHISSLKQILTVFGGKKAACHNYFQVALLASLSDSYVTSFNKDLRLV